MGKGKSKLETWSKRLALLGAVLGIIISLFSISDKIKEKFLPATSPLRGVVRDEEMQPIAGATVEVEQLPGKRQTTANDGSYSFDKVPGRTGDKVRVFVRKPNYKDRNEFVSLPAAPPIILEKAK